MRILPISLSLIVLSLIPSATSAGVIEIATQQQFDQYSAQRFSPGDIIQFKRGKEFTGMFAPLGSGTEKAPIRVTAFGNGPAPRIHAQGKHLAGVLLRNVEFWEVGDLEITNTNGTPDDQGVLFGIYVLAEDTNETLNHIHIHDCYIHHINGEVAGKRRGGIHIHVKGDQPARFHNLRIVGNRIERIGGVGIGNDSPHAQINFDQPDDPGRHAWTGVYVARNVVSHTGRNAIIARVSDNAVYEYNTLAYSSRHDTGHSIFNFHTRGIRIQYNEAYGNIGPGGQDRGGFDADYNSMDTYIQYNYSHDNQWFCGIMKRPNHNVFIRYNLSVNDRDGLYFYGFDSEKKASNIHIYNNTHYVGAHLDVEVFCEGRTPINTTFENNLFYFSGKGEWGPHAQGVHVKFDHNFYYNIPPHPTDQNPIVGDPLFRSPGMAPTFIDMTTRIALRGYTLKPDSPCIDRGKPIPDAGGQDLWDRRAPVGRFDIGAHEWRSMDSSPSN